MIPRSSTRSATPSRLSATRDSTSGWARRRGRCCGGPPGGGWPRPARSGCYRGAAGWPLRRLGRGLVVAVGELADEGVLQELDVLSHVDRRLERGERRVADASTDHDVVRQRAARAHPVRNWVPQTVSRIVTFLPGL